MDLLLLCRAESQAVAQGRVEGGRGWPLTTAGLDQADRLGERLARDFELAALYASPLQEAWETALRIGALVGLSPQPEPGLRDVNSGELAGRSLDEVEQERRMLLPPSNDIFTPFPGGESYAEMHVRVVKSVNRLVGTAGGETIALVSHPRPIQAYLLAFLRYAIEQRVELCLCADPASLHHLRRGTHGRKEIVRLNDIGHLRSG